MALSILLFFLSFFLSCAVKALDTVLETRISTLVIFGQHYGGHWVSELTRLTRLYDQVPTLSRNTMEGLTPHLLGHDVLLRQAQPNPQANGRRDAKSPIDTCLDTCRQTFSSINGCYDVLSLSSPSELLPPLQHFFNPSPKLKLANDTDKYRNCFCAENTGNMQYYLEAFTRCAGCVAPILNLDPRLSRGVLAKMDDNLRGFCATDKPSLFLFLYNTLNFLVTVDAPEDYPVRKGKIKDITSVAGHFTVDPGMNAISTPTYTTAVPTFEHNDGIKDWPAEWVYQIPLNWPHTTYAEARKPGQVTTLQITNAAGSLSGKGKESGGGEVAAILVATLQWYPRPLGQQKAMITGPSSSPASTPTPSSPQVSGTGSTGDVSVSRSSSETGSATSSTAPATTTQTPTTIFVISVTDSGTDTETLRLLTSWTGIIPGQPTTTTSSSHGLQIA